MIQLCLRDGVETSSSRRDWATSAPFISLRPPLVSLPAVDPISDDVSALTMIVQSDLFLNPMLHKRNGEFGNRRRPLKGLDRPTRIKNNSFRFGRSKSVEPSPRRECR